jgi:hypothetical protein
MTRGRAGGGDLREPLLGKQTDCNATALQRFSCPVIVA